jgi:hypothetical protein
MTYVNPNDLHGLAEFNSNNRWQLHDTVMYGGISPTFEHVPNGFPAASPALANPAVAIPGRHGS